MSEMVERVKAAIGAALMKQYPDIEDVARAAIEAMREPTDEMCKKGATAGGVRSTWVLMIDAALT